MADTRLKNSSLTLPAIPASSGLALALWLRGRRLRAAWQATRRSPLKLAVILAVWGTLVAGSYVLAYQGMRFIYDTSGVGPFMLDRLWYLCLFVIAIMLLVSQLATAYGTVIRAEETRAWMAWPLSSRWIIRAKWLESASYSAWAVLVMVLPLGVAYVQILHHSLALVAWLMAVFAPLVVIVTACSTMIVLSWLRWVRLRVRIPRELIAVGFVVVSGILFWVLGEHKRQAQEDVWFVALQELLPRMRLAMSIWMPSCWTARAWSAGLAQRWQEAGIFAALLWTTAAVTLRALDHLAAGVLWPVLLGQAERVEGASSVTPVSSAMRVSWGMRVPFRAYVTKDLLLLARDPVQWTQALVFFGLLWAYFANLHRLATMAVDPSWRIGVAGLHLACTLLVFGSLAVRFVFPQMSLEGRRLWLLHAAPGGLPRALLAKLVLYSGVGILIVEGLLSVSVARLQVPGVLRIWMAAVGCVASVSVVGLALGLGTLLIDPTVSDPAKFVSSSSGALALVLMLGYVGMIGWSLTLLWSWWLHGATMLLGFAGVVVVGGSLGFGALPLMLGLKRLASFEA